MADAETGDVEPGVSASTMLRRLDELEQLLRVDDELAALTATVATMAAELQRASPRWCADDQAAVARRVEDILGWAIARKAALQHSLAEHSRGRRAVAGYAR